MKLINYLLSISFILMTSSVLASGSVMTNNSAAKLKMVGQAEMRWFMLPLYRVTLSTTNGKYQENQFPQLLDILYLRNIDKQDLLTATDREWRGLGVSAKQRKEWIRQLGNLWPSVKRGDQLAFQVDPQGQNYFIYNNKKIGGIKDKQFGKSFLAIWLSPKTSRPYIRQNLINKG